MLTAMLFVKDLDAMARFYREGFDLVDDPEASAVGYVAFTGEAGKLSLHAVPEHISGQITIDDPPRPRTDSAMKLVFTVDDVPKVRTGLERLGAQLLDTADDHSVDYADPEGNVFRIRSS